MHGAILGDIWGSIFETIPKQPRRLLMCPTDDTFLTCACYEFMQSLSEQEIQNPKFNFQPIYDKAVFFLKKWGAMFPEHGAFSSGFLNWVNTPGTEYKVASTNGCLMRQSPIALLSVHHKISLENCIELSRIFCYPTHKSPESFNACELHITLLYKLLKKEIDKQHLSSIGAELHTLSYWIDFSNRTKNNFIWKANDSLNIAISATDTCANWENMMRFFISISGDVDTYAAIAGPIAQILYGNPSHTEYILFSLIDKANHEARYQNILNIYKELENIYLEIKNYE